MISAESWTPEFLDTLLYISVYTDSREIVFYRSGGKWNGKNTEIEKITPEEVIDLMPKYERAGCLVIPVSKQSESEPEPPVTKLGNSNVKTIGFELVTAVLQNLLKEAYAVILVDGERELKYIIDLTNHWICEGRPIGITTTTGLAEIIQWQVVERRGSARIFTRGTDYIYKIR